MSKAFTRESEIDDAPVAGLPPLDLPAGTPNYVTPTGLAALKERQAALTAERPGVARAAAGDGPDAAAARRRLTGIDLDLRALAERIDRAEVVEGGEAGVVRFGATVTLRGDEERVVTIVGIDEADAGRGRISWRSPLARALLGAAEGDVVTLRTPRGEEEVEVVGVRY